MQGREDQPFAGSGRDRGGPRLLATASAGIRSQDTFTMKKSPVRRPAARTAAGPPRPGPVSQGRIHPIIIYPFRHPADPSHLERLYRWVAELAADTKSYARPVTVVDRKTHHAMAGNREYLDFRNQTLGVHSDILDAWSVDTCQTWYTALGQAHDRGNPGDVYWMIPGDFNYGSQVGQEVLSRLHDLPEILLDLDQDLCVGEITTDHNNPKQLIDTYGTFALLYTWFPPRELRSASIPSDPDPSSLRSGTNSSVPCSGSAGMPTSRRWSSCFTPSSTIGGSVDSPWDRSRTSTTVRRPWPPRFSRWSGPSGC